MIFLIFHSAVMPWMPFKFMKIIWKSEIVQTWITMQSCIWSIQSRILHELGMIFHFCEYFIKNHKKIKKKTVFSASNYCAISHIVSLLSVIHRSKAIFRLNHPHHRIKYLHKILAMIWKWKQLLTSRNNYISIHGKKLKKFIKQLKIKFELFRQFKYDKILFHYIYHTYLIL